MKNGLFIRSLCLNGYINKEGKDMSYINAESVLPEDVIKLVQQYVDGEYLYVPRKNESHKHWGEKNGTKAMLKKRDREIFNKYCFGNTISELTKIYYLSERSIRRIISKEKSMSI